MFKMFTLHYCCPVGRMSSSQEFGSATLDHLTEVVGYTPDLRGFKRQLLLHYNAVYITETQNRWAKFVSSDDYIAIAMLFLRAYSHAVHNRRYNSGGFTTDSVSKVLATVDTLRVSRYVRDMVREVCRGIKLDQTIFVPYFPLQENGEGLVPGLGLNSSLLMAWSDTVRNRTDLDLVSLEEESPKDAPFGLSLPERTIYVAENPMIGWRLEAVKLLRHFSPECGFIFSDTRRAQRNQAQAQAMPNLVNVLDAAPADANAQLAGNPAFSIKYDGANAADANIGNFRNYSEILTGGNRPAEWIHKMDRHNRASARLVSAISRIDENAMNALLVPGPVSLFISQYMQVCWTIPTLEGFGDFKRFPTIEDNSLTPRPNPDKPKDKGKGKEKKSEKRIDKAKKKAEVAKQEGDPADVTE